MILKKWISLTWTLINSHYGISKAGITYFRQKKKLWEPILIYGSLIILAFFVVPLFVKLLDLAVKQYIAFGMGELFLGGAFLLTNLLGFFFGLFFLVSVFFFSDDMRVLMPLPLKPHIVLSSKFSVIILDQMWISLIGIIFPMVIYGINAEVDFMFWISLIVIFFFSQFFPLLLEIIIILPLSRVFKFKKNKDFLVYFISILVLVAALGFQFYINSGTVDSNISADQIAKMISDPNNLLNKIALGYPPAFLAVKSLTAGGVQSLLWMLLFTGMNIFMFWVVLFIGDRFYYSTYLEMQDRYTKRESLNNMEMEGVFGKSTNALKTLLLREWRYFLRVPAFAFNGFVNVLIFPILLIVMTASRGVTQLTPLIDMLQNFKSYLVPAGVLVGTLAGSINMLSVTIFSREGKMIRELKALPVQAKTIFLSKLIHVSLMSALGPISAGIALGILFSPTAFEIAMIIVISLVCTTFLNLLQMLIDCLRPVLNWDNPQKAMKGNINGLFSVIIVFGFAGLFGFLGYQLRDSLNPFFMSLVLLLTGLAGSILLYPLSLKKVDSLLKRDLF